jgi:hypothetical protein
MDRKRINYFNASTLIFIMVKPVFKVTDVLLPLAKKAIEKFRKGGRLTIEEMGYIARLFY